MKATYVTSRPDVTVTMTYYQAQKLYDKYNDVVYTKSAEERQLFDALYELGLRTS